MSMNDTTPQGVARSQAEADAEYEESLSILRHAWGIDHTAAPAVLSEMDARGMDITPDGVKYSEAAAVAVALGADPGHGDHDDPPPPTPRTGDPATQVIHTAHVVVNYWPDGTTTAEVLIDDTEDPVVQHGGTLERIPEDDQQCIDAITDCNWWMKNAYPLPVPGRPPFDSYS